MKCTNMIATRSVGRKGKTEIVACHPLVMENFAKFYEKTLLSDFAPCDGELSAEVRIEVEDGCSCCGHSVLNVTFNCTKCGEVVVGKNLPDRYTFQSWLNKLMSSVDSVDFEDVTAKVNRQRDEIHELVTLGIPYPDANKFVSFGIELPKKYKKLLTSSENV